MKQVVNSAEMKALDKNTIEKHGISSMVLMERAALAVIEELHNHSFELTNVLVVCGSGNNGGDGIAIARLMHLAGIKVSVFQLGNLDHMSEECKKQTMIASSYSVPFVNNPVYSEYTTIVDAIFGVGLSRSVEGVYKDVIENINQVHGKVIAVDIPSGINADNGQVMGCAVQADVTVTFAFPKIGLCLYPGKQYSGILIVRDIGIYERQERLIIDQATNQTYIQKIKRKTDLFIGQKIEQITNQNIDQKAERITNYSIDQKAERITNYSIDQKAEKKTGQIKEQKTNQDTKLKTNLILNQKRYVLEPSDLALIPKRNADSNKSTFGKVLVVAGSEGMAGAALLCARAVMRCGAGMAKIITHTSNRIILQQSLPEVMVGTYNNSEEAIEQLRLGLLWADVVVCGCGLGTDYPAEDIVSYLIKNTTLPLVLDADALNVLSKHEKWLDNCSVSCTITPHLGEMSRLCKKSIKEIKEDLINTAKTFAQKHKVYCVLKDAVSCVATPDGSIFLNNTGNCGMATAGAGDVLAGIIAGLLAVHVHEIYAPALGVYVHGLAGDNAKRRYGEAFMMASDIIESLSKVF